MSSVIIIIIIDANAYMQNLEVCELGNYSKGSHAPEKIQQKLQPFHNSFCKIIVFLNKT